MIYLSLVIIVTTLIIRYLRDWYTFWDRQGVKGPLYLDFSKASNILTEMVPKYATKYGKIYGSYSLFQRILVVNDPEAVKEILLTHHSQCHPHRDFNFGKSVSKSLFCIPYKEDFKRIRSIVSPAFTSSKLRTMTANISQVCDQLITNITVYATNGEEVDLTNHIHGFAMDSISLCAYGTKTDCVNNLDHPLVENVKKFLNTNVTLNMIVALLAPKLARSIGIEYLDKEVSKFLTEFSKEIINKRMESNNKMKKIDFIQAMVDALPADHQDNSKTNKRQEKGFQYISYDEIVGQSVFFYFAGSITTATTLLHGFYHLAKNKDCQQRLYEELKDIGEYSYDVLTKLKYLNAVINETLRLSTPIFSLTRTTECDLILNRINVPSGTCIVIMPYAIHTDPDYWPDPFKFKPDRFLESTFHQYSYLPFGSGPRICVGYQFALHELRICLTKMITKFEFSLSPGFNQLEYFLGNAINIPKSVKVNLKAR